MSDVNPQRNPYPGTKEILPELLADIRKKAEDGKVKYGTYLQANNGRRALADLYQELIDACFYVKQELMERENKPIVHRGSMTEFLDDCELSSMLSETFQSLRNNESFSNWTSTAPPAVDVGPLMTGHKLVHGERGSKYGHPYEDFGRTAELVSVLLRPRLKESIRPEDIALIMLCVKLSREMNHPQADNLTDAAGYIETWWMVKKVNEHVLRTGQVPDLSRRA